MQKERHRHDTRLSYPIQSLLHTLLSRLAIDNPDSSNHFHYAYDRNRLISEILTTAHRDSHCRQNVYSKLVEVTLSRNFSRRIGKSVLSGDTTAQLNREELARLESGNLSTPPAPTSGSGPNSVINNPGQLTGGLNSVINNPGQLTGGPNSVINNPGQLPPPEFSPPTPSVFAPPNRTIVPVFFGTDRAFADAGNNANQYTAHRSQTITYGYANVSIPAIHKLGQIERPTLWKLEFRDDPAKHVVITEIMPMDKVAFFGRVRSRVDADTEKRVFVFIHGYNVPFDDALRRTAQIAYDLKYPGAPILFSWPSFGEPLKYPYDAQNAAWAVPDLEAFLLEVEANSGATQIDVIAHSMGNQALIAALQDITAKHQSLQLREIVLAAPDIDADLFIRAVPAIMSKAARVTLYASSKDQALNASKKFNGFARAGDASEGIVVLPGMDTIDASDVDTSFLGHSYYGDNRSVLADIDNLFRTNSPPGNRFGLFPMFHNGEEYWRFAP